jgi:hypothetical protein
MKRSTLKKYFLYYTTTESNKKFVYGIRNCKRPETTREYKKLHWMLYSGLIQSCGYCDEGYYTDYQDLFINNLRPGNLIYIQSKLN